MYLYINNLRELPNFGCRTTGIALKKILEKSVQLKQYDAMESVNEGGWDTYARGPLKNGGIIPRYIYNRSWKFRKQAPHAHRLIKLIDQITGGQHDYISTNPNQSVLQYKKFIPENPRIALLEEQINESKGIIINGEGTLIFSNPMLRDALYLLFIIAMAKEKNKPVFLLNSMVAPCPYTGEDKETLERALPLLAYCKKVAVRDHTSYEYLSSKIGSNNLDLIPDALFTLGDDIRAAASIIRKHAWISEPFPSNQDFSNLSFDEPYICVSGSSSAWRHEPEIRTQFKKLISKIKELGYPIYCVETCDGDSFLKQIAESCGVPFVHKNTPVIAAAGIIANSLVYITGRYHPSIMASASGTPCVFLSSNSHKTQSIQTLLGYKNQTEYSICPNESQISNIISHINCLIANRQTYQNEILSNFQIQGEKAMRYATILTN